MFFQISHERFLIKKVPARCRPNLTQLTTIMTPAPPHDRSPKIRDSIVVSISACHAEDPGSIPGRGTLPWRTHSEARSVGTIVLGVVAWRGRNAK